MLTLLVAGLALLQVRYLQSREVTVLMLTRYRPRTFALELLMIFVALLFAYPVYVLVNLSLKNPHEIAEAGIGPPSHLETANYSNAWSGAHLGAAMMNSTIITVVSLVCLIMIGSTAAYYLARTQSRLSYGMYLLFLLGHRAAVPARARARSTGS